MSVFTLEENKKVLSIIVNLRHLKTKNNFRSTNEMIQCPFHKDKTPSMSIDLSRGICHCFSCGWKGTLNKLAKETVNKSAYSIVQKKFNEELEDFNSFTITFQPKSLEEIKQTPKVTLEIEGDLTHLNDACLVYLAGRGISSDLARKFKMRYMEHGYINGTPFHKRLLIPVYESGSLLAYEGRDITGSSKKKVLYPKNSSVNTLYDLDNLKRDEPLYVTEGLMDLIILRAHPFFRNSTSLFGASFTERKAALLSEFKSVVFIPDNDAAGFESIERYSQKITSPVIKVLPVPEPMKDPGDFYKFKFNLEQRAIQWLKTQMLYAEWESSFGTKYLKQMRRK